MTYYSLSLAPTRFASCKIYHEETVHSSISIGGVSNRRYCYGRHKWLADISFPLLHLEEFAAYWGELAGHTRTIYTGGVLPVALPRTRAATPWTTNFYDFAYLDDNSVHSRGWTPGLGVEKGEFFFVKGKLHIVTASATADGTGALILNFYPPMKARLSQQDFFGALGTSHGNGLYDNAMGGATYIKLNSYVRGDIGFDVVGDFYQIHPVTIAEASTNDFS